MKIEVKGHSGCKIDVASEGSGIYVYKSTADPKYLTRLVLQAEKQKAAAAVEYQHIRVPQIYEIDKTDETVVVKMQYVYSKNFIEFFEQAGFEQIDYLVGALKYFIEYEIDQCRLETVSPEIFREKFADVQGKCLSNPLYQDDETVTEILVRSEKVFDNLQEMLIPVGLCHGDLTFSNILFNGNNYYLIDFLDSFIETPLQDIVKIRQDTAFRWSQLMYTKRYDAVRLHIVMEKMDQEIDSYFRNKYQWYREYYQVMQLMNILRILPYAHEQRVVEYLKTTLLRILVGLEGDKKAAPTKPVLSTQSDLSSTTKTLIVPVAADKAEYADGLPYVFGFDRDGVIICIKSILGLDLSKFDKIYFTVLKKHDEKFFIVDILNLQFKRLGIRNAKVVVLDNPTQDQAETVYQTITKERIQGSIFIKDSDCYFRTELSEGNSIAIYPIEELEILAPKDKSYVAVDDMYYLTNIIEKSLVGHYISAGGYSINRAEDFVDYYIRLRDYGRLYLSHIIYAMLLDKKSFRPMLVEDYKDWGDVKLLDA